MNQKRWQVLVRFWSRFLGPLATGFFQRMVGISARAHCAVSDPGHTVFAVPSPAASRSAGKGAQLHAPDDVNVLARQCDPAIALEAM